MKDKIKKYFDGNIMAQVFASYAIAALSCAAIFYKLLPKLLNYAPRYDYIDELSGPSYFTQYVVMVAGALLVGYFIIFFCLRGVKEVEAYFKKPQEKVPDNMQKMMRKLLHLPYMLYTIQIGVPTISVMIMVLPMYIIEKASLFVFFRVFMMMVAFFVLVSIVTLVVSQQAFKKLLLRFQYYSNIGGSRIPMASKLYIQILSMFIVAIVFSSLIGYSNNIRDKGDLISESYLTALKETFAPYKNNMLLDDKIHAELLHVRKVNNMDDVRFVIDPHGNVWTSDDKELSGYFLIYLKELSYQNGGFVYDVTEENRGVIVTVQGNDGVYTVGVKYEIGSSNLAFFYIVSLVLIIGLCSFVLYFLSKALSEDIITVTKSMEEMASGEYESLSKRLPVSTNDEISALILSFNRIQELVQEHIKQIRSNHEVLIQNERLASLGQLIGGIAHSLKTPISTASDATQCINTLAVEYDESIENKIVTEEDHHNIAAEIKMHVKDLKETLDYINSIINTVKNHAAEIENDGNERFTVKDLISSINILMSNELKKYGCRLNINTNMAEDEMIRGDIRSLIQIVDVLISNAIQAYPQGNGQIDFSILKGDNEIKLIVKDYGVGIPKGIQNKILNKMVTTRGNKGTGIGLYISNSIVKAKFNGSLSFESEEGKGTKFRIILPLKKEEE